MIETKTPKKITKMRLKNIALYYLERYESSVKNLREVLKRRVDKYAFQMPDFNKNEAYGWIEEVVQDCVRLKYVDDERFATIKIKNYLLAGKSQRYIQQKLQTKGIQADFIEDCIAKENYDPKQAALMLAQKKRIGPYRNSAAERIKNRQKDFGILLRAGFDYDVVCDILNENFNDE